MNTSQTPGSSPLSGLVLTGERTLPGIPHENYWFQRHVVAYRQLTPAAADRVVLDAGCGEGYGLALFAEAGAARVIGVDLDETAVAHARSAYATGSEVIEVHAAELMALPLADDTVDLTVSLQVIEHLYDVPGYLRSLRRVTRPGGAVVIATPNRLTFTPGSDVPVNPFHTREFTAAELADELTDAGLEVTTMRGIGHGPRIRDLETAAARPLPDLVSETDPEDWSDDLRRFVVSLSAADFDVTETDLDASLDLLFTCRVPGRG